MTHVPDAVAIDAAIDRARHAGSPVVDDGGATFVWLGDGPGPIVFGDWCDWEPGAGLRLEPHDEGWAARIELPPDAYVEYALLHRGRRVPDPLNANRVDNGFHKWNEQLWMPQASRRLETLRTREVPSGTLVDGRVRLPFLAAPPRERRLDLYLPAPELAPDPGRLPLLLILDGSDYLERGELQRTLDVLIADREMAPVAAAFIANSPDARSVEYGASDFTLAVLADTVVPAAERRLGLAPQRSETGPGRATILGSSLGGLMALHAVTRRPDVFGSGIAQSTSAMLDDADLPGPLPQVRLSTIALIEATAAPPVRLWLDAGDLEPLAGPNDRLAALLVDRGWDVTYRRQHGGHNQTSWAEALLDALPAMFPPAGA
jgi:enterochelin esterase family protein